ncbi:MAG TPA: hypothetical protein VK437_12920 [Steroidobacteraceae bacterium]|nr:hypothetical protein [Steroidobacteraceae bacterium]
MALTAAAFARARAQGNEALQSWGEATGAALIRLLPKAGPGLSATPAPVLSAFANDGYGYKGPQPIVHRYPTYRVSQEWTFDDPELDQKIAAVRAQAKAEQDEYPRKLEEFRRAHAADRQAAEQAYQVEHAKAEQEMAARTAKLNELIKEGKYSEVGKLGDPPQNLGPFVYAPERAFQDAADARSKDLDQRARALESSRRAVEFWIYTNRTPESTQGRHPTAAGTLAGHPLFRETNPRLNTPSSELLNLGVLVGSPDVEVAQAPSTALAVKAISVWAFLRTRPETAAADEARVRKILESGDYPGLAKLIAP